MGLLLFTVHLQFPDSLNFDEAHYVPAARDWMQLQINRNFEHPPLGKILIAAGIALFGDRPIGWRVMSILFGSATLVAMYVWSLALFRRERVAWWVTLLSLCNFLLYVQARIAMLDTFMFGFLVWAFVFFSAAWDDQLNPKLIRRYLAASGVFFGFATACKWAAFFPWISCLGITAVVLMIPRSRLLHARLERLSLWDGKPGFHYWYSPRLWKGFRLREIFIYLGIIPLLVYFSTFLPFLLVHRQPHYGLMDLISMQSEMWAAQRRVLGTHPYMSDWTSWPFMSRPIWYSFTLDPQGFARGVILLQNPLLAWAGLLALVFCGWAAYARKMRSAFLITLFFSSVYFGWAIVPRKIAFYYYYYPAGMILSLALAQAFEVAERKFGRRIHGLRWVFAAAVVALFVHFFPILAALKIKGAEFRDWMWFRSWI